MNTRLLIVCLCLVFTAQASRAQTSESPWDRPEVRQAFVDESAMLPVSSQHLTPGRVENRPLDMPGMPAFFLVGADPQSLQWLADRADELTAINAAGLAVKVRDAADLQRIRDAAPSLTILPVNGDSIAQRLQIEHYPVLITSQSLEQ